MLDTATPIKTDYFLNIISLIHLIGRHLNTLFNISGVKRNFKKSTPLKVGVLL